ncbi:MAG: FAD-dependent oxidoreductase [Myxococcales bacterium]|nr:FAD-dependent oxidoreductase [Myxococcales bacterium]
MDDCEFLIIGGGMTGLAFAEEVHDRDYLIVEAEEEPGGYCRTIHQDGFVWDYSGHFFHFKHPDIEQHLVSRMGDQKVLKVARESRIYWEGDLVDFPFQKNIHQLPKDAFIDCLVDLYFKEDREVDNFHDMLYAKFGRGIAERFLIPYNEKLYATDLRTLDVDAMGRFFPHANRDEIIRNFKNPDNSSYNATFTYPEGGAMQYVNALLQGIDRGRLCLGERVLAIDVEDRVARTTAREIRYQQLVSTVPFPRLLEMAEVSHDPAIYTWNKVLVFNLGFDRKGPEKVHWIYFPQRELPFYRVGFYDNIFGADRMSLYVELGFPRDANVTPEQIDSLRTEVLSALEKVSIVEGHQLVSSHAIILDPAYVHITKASTADVERHRESLASKGVFSAGRYGSWTYCSIEDNIVEARALARSIAS